MSDPAWNVVATVYDREYRDAKSRLDVRRPAYRNVLLMKVADLGGFLEFESRARDVRPRSISTIRTSSS